MVRNYPIDEEVVLRAVRAAGERPTEQVIREALEQYAASQQVISGDEFEARVGQWLSEGRSFSDGRPGSSDAFGDALAEKYRKQGLVI